MKIPMVALAAFLAIIPLNSSAQSGGCELNGVEVPGDPELIEGTSSADRIDCRTSPTRHDIYGYGGGDEIYGSPFGDFIAGGGGNDTIFGGDGDDAIDGGAQDDHIYGEGGHDIIFGGVGASPASGVGCVLLTAAAGRIYLTKGGSGDDTIFGGDGNDCIDAGSGEDRVYGGDGNDTIEGGNHADYLDGGLDDDWIDGGWHTDTCFGGGGNDILISCELGGGSAPDCGNGTKEQGEECDGEDFGDATCGDFSCSGGNLTCSGSCTLDTFSCDGCPLCDNDGICDPGEDCNNCSNDCAEKSKGKPSERYCCGDGETQSAESGSTICDGNF